tara:strand:- start:212 stop:802 length:591 start_codon:yes stop_codon:yes gene_type:complete
MKIKSIEVFCGSSSGENPRFYEAAYELGKFLAASNIELIYGGAKIGIMGAIAQGSLDHHGRVVGVLPEFLKTKEIAHPELSEIISTNSMHERKMIMHELSDAVLTLPGGFGTLDELFEMLTWSQLGLHQKPIGLYNINSYFDSLLEFIKKMNTEGFLNQANMELILAHKSLDKLFEAMENFNPPPVPKWIKSSSQT